MHDVRQVQHERRLGHVHRRAVRRQRVGDRAHGVLVLLQVLGRAGQRRGEREVVGVVAGTPDRAGQHAGGDQALLAAGRAAPASRRRARRRRTPRCCRSARPAAAAASARRSARPASTTRSRASTTLSSSPAVIRATAAATAPAHSAPERAPSAKATSAGAGGGSCERRVDGRPAGGRSTADRGQPPPSAAPADDHLGHDQRGAGWPSRRRTRSTRTRPARCRAGRPRRAPPRAPPRRATSAWACANRCSPLRLEGQRAPPADQPLAAADPGHTSVAAPRDQRQQRAPGRRSPRCGRPRRGQAGGRGVGAGIGRGRHGQQAYDGRRASPGTRCRPARRRRVTAAVPLRRRHRGG